MLALIVFAVFFVTLVFALKGVVWLLAPRPLYRRLSGGRRPTTDRVLIREANCALDEKERLAARYPNGVIKYAGDDTTGMSVYEVDINNWAYVRSLEFGVYGAYYHRADGTTNACGWEPIDEGAEAAHAKTAEYQAKIARKNELRGQHAPGTGSDAATRARIIEEGMADEDPAQVSTVKVIPWPAEIETLLHEAGLDGLDGDGVLAWSYSEDRRGQLCGFEARYHDKSVRVQRIGDNWHVSRSVNW